MRQGRSAQFAVVGEFLQFDEGRVERQLKLPIGFELEIIELRGQNLAPSRTRIRIPTTSLMSRTMTILASFD